MSFSVFPSVLISDKSLHAGAAMFLLDFLDAALLQSLINGWWMFVKIFVQNEPFSLGGMALLNEKIFTNHFNI